MMKIKVLATYLILYTSLSLWAQNTMVSITGKLQDKATKTALSFANIVLKKTIDSSFVSGVISDEKGQFTLEHISPGDYLLELSLLGYTSSTTSLFIGKSSPYLDLGVLNLNESIEQLNEVLITGEQSAINAKLDKKTYTLEKNLSQGGGSVLQAMQNLPGISMQDGKVQLRGNDRVMVLIDGKQTALTGYGTQNGLDNIPASSIEKIEIINNPSAKFDANGNAGIINIVFKKEEKDGFNGSVGFTGGLGALWVKKENLPTVSTQYKNTPKINPSVSLNYRKKNINAFVQVDNLYTKTLNKNEFVSRTYDDGTTINQQTRRNRNTNYLTTKAGIDWFLNSQNSFTFSGLFGSEKIIDHGEEPFFNTQNSERLRLWKFIEDELKTTLMGSAQYQHQFNKAGHALTTSFNYTFHRENEQYSFNNILPTYTSRDAFKLLSDENVIDFKVDYVKPLRTGRLETGVKYRKRFIPTNMQYYPGLNSPLDTNAGGKATYKENIPALYGNYTFESRRIETEIGLRVEYVQLNYYVNPSHNTYKSNGYNYLQPFPTARFTYKLNPKNNVSIFVSRRVDRPSEVDIRIFPKYDDAQIIKVGNPALKPQFTNTAEIAYRTSWQKGYLYTAAYHKITNGTITRIATITDSTQIIYTVFQNVNKSYNSGVEIVYDQTVNKQVSFNLNINAYHNQINAYQVVNLYPTPSIYSSQKQELFFR